MCGECAVRDQQFEINTSESTKGEWDGFDWLRADTRGARCVERVSTSCVSQNATRNQQNGLGRRNLSPADGISARPGERLGEMVWTYADGISQAARLRRDVVGLKDTGGVFTLGGAKSDDFCAVEGTID